MNNHAAFASLMQNLLSTQKQFIKVQNADN